MESNYQQEDGFGSNIDYIRLLRICIKYWWVFAISVFCTLSISIIYNKYSTSIYKAGTVILLKENDKPSSMYELTEGFGLSKEINNIENQKFIYSSPKNIGRAIDNLKFQITYINIGHIRNDEVYGEGQRIVVNYDTAHIQPIGATFEIEKLTNNELKLHVFGKEIYGYSYLTNSYSDYYTQNIDTTFNVNIGERITNKMFSFTIVPYNIITPDDYSKKIRFFFNTRHDLITQWRSQLNIETNQEGGTIAQVTAIGQNISKLLDFLRAMNDATIRYSLDKKNETANRTLYFLNKQLEQTADSLRNAQEALRQFKEKYNFASNTMYSTQLQQSYFEKDKELQKTMLQLEYLKIINDKLKSGEDIEDYFAVTTSDNTGNSLISKQIQELIAIQQSLNALKSQNDNNPYKKQLIENADLLRNNLKVIISQSIDSYEKNIASNKKRLNDMISEADRLPKVEAEFANLQRNYKIQDDVYTFLLQKSSEAQIAKASNVSDNDVLQEPTYLSQISPNRRKNNMMALALGFLLPAAFFFARELFNNKVRSTKELKRILPDISIIGVIPQGSKTMADMPAISDPQSAISESFRTLRSKLNFLEANKKKKTILFSSCNAGEGKTFCSLNVGINFALTGQRCIILNYDLRRPRLEKALNINHSHIGITDYLVGRTSIDDIIVPTELENLWIMPAGTIPPNPAELIASDTSKQLIQYAKDNFDIVIIDTAPIGYVADCRVLEPFCDIFIFVVKANICEYQHLRDTIESLKNENIASLCLLFNGETHSKGKKYYNNYYSSYRSHTNKQ